MSSEYGALSCDGADPQLATFVCPNCDDDDDSWDDCTPLVGWLVDMLFLPTIVVMGIATTLLIASASMWGCTTCGWNLLST